MFVFRVADAGLVTSRCEERFVGYGHNKIACTWSWFLDGIDYYVLPDDFVIHQDHPYVLKEKAFDVSLKNDHDWNSPHLVLFDRFAG